MLMLMFFSLCSNWIKDEFDCGLFIKPSGRVEMQLDRVQAGHDEDGLPKSIGALKILWHRCLPSPDSLPGSEERVVCF